MIWQGETGVIVMLTKEIESAKLKCFRYWPDETSEFGPARRCADSPRRRTELSFGKYSVKLVNTFHSDDGRYTWRAIELTARFSQEVVRRCSTARVQTAQVREIKQFCFHAWPDHGAPESTKDLLDFYWLAKAGEFHR